MLNASWDIIYESFLYGSTQIFVANHEAEPSILENSSKEFSYARR